MASTRDPFNSIKTSATSSKNAIKSKDGNIVAGDLSDKQFYTGEASDTTSVKIPIVYGTVLTKGVIIDEETVSETAPFAGSVSKDIINYKNYKILISEGDCNGIKSNILNHTIINGVPLQDPTDPSIVELAGVEVKQKQTTTSSSWGTTSNRFSSISKAIDISPFKTGTTDLEDSIIRKGGFLQGLADVSATLTNNHILKYNADAEKFVSVHLNDAANDIGLYLTSASSPYGVIEDKSTWILPTAGSFTVTLATDNRASQSPFRWWKNAADSGGSGNTNTSSAYASTCLHFDGLARPDVLLYEGATYSFTCSSLGSGNGFYMTTDGTTEYTTGVTNSKTESATFTITPTSSTPRVLYYRTVAGINTGGRVLIKEVA